jgi:hypothetical protein
MYTALLERVTTPGRDGMRFALFLINLSVLERPLPIAGFQSDGNTVVPSHSSPADLAGKARLRSRRLASARTGTRISGVSFGKEHLPRL